MEKIDTPLPNPGSDEAIKLGCICPVLDNGHGRGDGPFWVRGDCPIHGLPVTEQLKEIRGGKA